MRKAVRIVYLAARRLSIILAFSIAVTLALTVLVWSRNTLGDEWFERTTERSDVFEYLAVDFVRVDPDEGWLVMQSTSAWFMTAEHVVWNDELRCGPRSELVDSQTTRADDFQPKELDVTEWPWNGSYPKSGRVTCFMRSTITVTIRGVAFRQQLDSPRFIPGP